MRGNNANNAMMVWMRFVALLVYTLECLGKVKGGSGSQDAKLDKKVMKKFSNFLYRESSRPIDSGWVDDENDDRDQLSMDLVTSFFWGQQNGVGMEVGALDGARLSESRPLLDLNWRREPSVRKSQSKSAYHGYTAQDQCSSRKKLVLG